MNNTLLEKNLNPTQDIFSLLGNLCNNPKLLMNADIKLSADDFVNNFHKIIYYAINNLISKNGKIKEITSLDIDTYLKQSDTYYYIWNGKNNGIEYIQDAKELSNEALFKQNYSTLKKMTVLRKYCEDGFDISDILDFETTEPEVLSQQQKRLMHMTASDIVEYFTKRALTTREDLKSNVENGITYFKAGDGLSDLKERMNRAPSFGYPFRNPFFNTLFNGMQQGKFLLRSASTGGGKTRQAIMDMLYVACSEMRDSQTNQWVKLPPSKPSLFISTELEKEELQEQMISFITKIPPEIIKAGNYTSKIEKNIDKAIEILEEAPFWIIEMEEFDTDDIKNEIERYILNHDIEYVNFDYIQMNPKLSSSMQNNFGHQLKDDQILLEVSRVLKNIAKEYDIFIETSTQLNASHTEMNVELSRTQNALRGAKSIADKIDYGIIVAPPTEKDLKQINNIECEVTPNMSYWVYKNRNSKKHIVIWSHLDLGTMREEFLFTTDYHYNVDNADVDETYINVEEDGTFNINSDKIEV